MLRAEAERRDYAFREAVAAAHLNAWLGRVKKFPKLDEILKPKPRRRRGKPKSWQNQLAGWEAFLRRG